LSDEAIALHAGQWLTVRVGAREVFVRDFDREAPRPLSGGEATTAAPADSAPGVAPPAPAQASMGSPGKARRSVQASPLQSANAEVDWGAARAEGDWKRVLDLATRRGIDQSIAERSSEDLALLADAAHYLRRDDIASQALLAQRRRFPGSTRARDAAFLLGRIIEARTGGDSEALGWYDRHLAEAPDGAYASEALGRKMTVLARLHGEEAARPVAEEYLRRYPTGTYVRAARAFAKRP
jgi:TolA-binding protein